MSTEINNWKQKIFKDLLEKAKKESHETSFYALSKYLSENIFQSISDKTLTRYLSGVYEGTPSRANMNDICQYLGYENYMDYVEKNSSTEKTVSSENNKKEKKKKKKKVLEETTRNRPPQKINTALTITISALSLVGIATYLGVTKPSVENTKIGHQNIIENQIIQGNQINESNTLIPERNKNTSVSDEKRSSITENNCMYWTNTYYAEINCNAIENLPQDIHLEPKDEMKIKHFKKLMIQDTAKFLQQCKQRKFWYSKTHNQIEIFTQPGINPVTQKSLRELSNYMIDKYFRKKEI